MKKRISPNVKAHLIRGAFYLLLLLVVCISGSLLAFFRPDAPSEFSQGTLTFAQRIAHQRAIEEVYWRHRIWPRHGGERADPKPSLDTVMSRAQIEKKVTDYLRKSQALENCWHQPITAEQLQAEMDRMAKHSKQPDVLRELFEALGNDAFVIAECLARPALAERLLASWNANDVRSHGERQQREEATLPSNPTGQLTTVASLAAPFRFWQARTPKRTTNTIRTLTGRYTLPTDIGNQGAGGRYNPNIDSWVPTTVVLSGRSGHTAVWTGSEMILWGGVSFDGSNYQYFNTGARYNPSTDNWTMTSTTDAPSARDRHTAVWTGSEMIVWGGGTYPTYYDTGGRYNPATDTWTATSLTNVPAARTGHTAVWTGSEMIVWGGYGASGYPNTGGRYDPAANTWTATNTTNAPTGRSGHTAVWTGDEMIVWGGGPNTGGRYNPATDSWIATSTANAPTPRSGHAAVWTGSDMIVWAGSNYSYPYYADTGGKYDPVTDSWAAISTSNAPSGRTVPSAVWTGSEMIVWGGYFFDIYSGTYSYLGTGGRYDPQADSWVPASPPLGGGNPTGIWTGSEMIVWGGGVSNTGLRYSPATDSWISTSTINAPSARSGQSAVWTGSEMIIWGGWNGAGNFFNSGGRYDPTTDSWATTSATNAPAGRDLHTAVWTGSEMIIWGGVGSGGAYFNTGGRYNPKTDIWAPTSTTHAPGGRGRHTAVWTGNQMIVWGGALVGFDITHTGGRYNPTTDTWMATTELNVPDRRYAHTAVWTGNEMIVWGGSTMCPPCYSYTGGKYNPITDSWTATSIINAPSSRYEHTAVWTGNEMIVWGGYFQSEGSFNTGGRYSPAADSWASTSIINAPAARFQHTAVWTGEEMIVWGGLIQRPTPMTTATPTATPTATVTVSPSPTATPSETIPPVRATPIPRGRPTPAPRP